LLFFVAIGCSNKKMLPKCCPTKKKTFLFRKFFSKILSNVSSDPCHRGGNWRGPGTHGWVRVKKKKDEWHGMEMIVIHHYLSISTKMKSFFFRKGNYVFRMGTFW